MSTLKRLDDARTPAHSSIPLSERDLVSDDAARRAKHKAMHPSNYRGIMLVGALAAASATALVTAPASAATPASFDITGGALSISAPIASVSLGTQVASTSSFVISGPLGTISVVDDRGGATSWAVSVISTAFTPSAGPAVPASDVSYATGAFTTSGAATPVGTNSSDLTGVTSVVSATSTGISSVSWNPVISIAVPANFAPGHYVATITHSVA